MPIYEYRCPKCDHVFEEWQKGFAENSPACPQCGEPSIRIISGSAFLLKGSGWYATDYTDRRPEVVHKYSGKNKKPKCKPVTVEQLVPEPAKTAPKPAKKDKSTTSS
ncbi:FmdB family zinc ribbon protein [Desulfolutivibrio sulfoxidireducens]|uniref:FmdB family zinc ribbon protein n=1 Tax=Desulfolutivibrio sulfoxidireducens TaxID=2773299 RepID=UPI00159D3B8E|nr:zinc ribbon domain-containing protein [Desulfolutivibrio sulfoxidireducens]QLA17952.1 zinc ribbon domain-containing protein [Desulfolutivibrio sulfoxidireducens]QLA21530.1 zinc ribbon domain-containing protein [Desulfolutivibrio sulfoxidireducens]